MCSRRRNLSSTSLVLTCRFSCFLSSSLRLHYELSAGSSHPEICTGHSPAVTITFTCPSSRRLVGGIHSHMRPWKTWPIFTFRSLRVICCIQYIYFRLFFRPSLRHFFVLWFHRAALRRWRPSWTVVTRWNGWPNTPVTGTTWRATPANWPANSMTSLSTWHLSPWAVSGFPSKPPCEFRWKVWPTDWYIIFSHFNFLKQISTFFFCLFLARLQTWWIKLIFYFKSRCCYFTILKK